MLNFKKKLLNILRKSLTGFETLEYTKRLTSGASRITYEVCIICKGKPKKLALRINPTDFNENGLMSQRITPFKEAKVMQLARSAGIPTPEIIYIFKEEDDLGEGYLMDWMEGESVGSKIARGDEFKEIRPVLAKQCGQILGRLHSIDICANSLEGFLEKLKPIDYISQQYRIYKSLGVQRPMIEYIARWLFENPPRDRPLCLVHNDFRNGNLLVNKSSGISGVLDWEIAHIGNPIRDIGWLCTPSWRFGVSRKTVGGFGMLDDLLASYEASGGIKLEDEELKFWIVFGSFWWAIACMLMEKSYENGEDKSIERPIIGRRISECEMDCVNLLIPGKTTLNPKTMVERLEKQRDPLLITSIKKYVEEEIFQKARGRRRFLAAIACNALDITIREYKYDKYFAESEQKQLEKLLKRKGNLSSLRSEIASAIQDKNISLGCEGLKQYLRDSTLLQILIDQPNYPGLEEFKNSIF